MTSTRHYRRFVFSTPSDLMSLEGSSTVGTGQRLRLYQAMARLETVTPLQLAMATDNSAWFIDGWLQAQTRAGYIALDEQTEQYALFCRIRTVNH